MKQWLIFGFVLMLLPFASALLISPGIVELEYGESAEFNLTIINDISQDIVVQVSFESYENKIDYTDYFEIEGYKINKIEVPAGASKTLFFNLDFPELEQFGDLRFAIIRFFQVPLTQSEMAATVAVLIPVETNIPYPDTYVKVELEEPGVVKQGDDVLFSAVLTHLGKNVINEIIGNFVVTGNGVQDEVAINPLDLFLPAESQTVQANYDTLELNPGKYNLSLALSYDGNNKESKPVKLIVGAESVEVLDFNPKNLNANTMNTATFTLFSLWVEDLDVELSMDLLEGGEIVKNFEFGSYTLSVNEEKVISNGLDLNGIMDGNYVAQIKAKVGEETITKDFDVTLTSSDLSNAPEKENSWLLYASIALCLIAVILFIVYMVKKKKDEENNLGGNF